jgi:hypothetical protein
MHASGSVPTQNTHQVVAQDHPQAALNRRQLVLHVSVEGTVLEGCTALLHRYTGRPGIGVHHQQRRPALQIRLCSCGPEDKPRVAVANYTSLNCTMQVVFVLPGPLPYAELCQVRTANPPPPSYLCSLPHMLVASRACHLK